MSYAVKYRLNYRDLLNVSKRIDILEDGYTGSVTVVKGSPNPVVWQWMPDSEYKYPQIVASSCDLFLISPYRRYFLKLFTANKFKYKVQYYVANTMRWTGYLLPDLYSEAYDRKNYEVNFKAADGLGLLANINFDLTGVNSDLDIIRYCLNKLQLEHQIYTAVNIYETNMDMDADDDPLTQAYTDCALYSDMNCAEVVRETLKPYGAILYMDNNAWHIVRFSQLSGSYVRRLYDYDGTFIESETYNPLVSLTSDAAPSEERNIMLMGASRLVIIPGAKQIDIEQDYGLLDNILPGGDFHISEFSKVFLVSSYWERFISSSSEVSGWYLDKKKGQMYVGLHGVATNFLVPPEYIQASVQLEPDSKLFEVSFSYRLDAVKSGEGFRNAVADVYFQIYVKETGIDRWYILTEDGWIQSLWTMTGPKIKLEDCPSSLNYSTYTISGAGIPDGTDGLVKVRVFQVVDDRSFPYWLNFSVYVSEVKMTLSPTSTIPLDTEIDFTTIVDEGNNYIPEKISILSADVPDTANNVALYKNKKMLADGSCTNLWTEPGSDVNENLIVSLARIISDQYARPTIMYEALIRDVHLTFANVIYDIFDGLKYRMLEIVSYSDALCDMNIKACEIIEGVNSVGTEEDDEITTEEDEIIITE